MTKPIDQTWTATDQGTVDAGYGAILQRDSSSAPDIERARLASAAPEMARVLLAIEYIEMEHCSTCPVCATPAELIGGHKPDCALDAALRKAGVR